MSNTLAFFVNDNGEYLTQCDHDYGVAQGWTEVPFPPEVSTQLWSFRLNSWEPVPLTVEDYRVAVQSHLDTTAQNLGYDSITNAISYADELAVPKFQQEGLALRAWRSLVWDYCYGQLALVEAGEIEAPSIEQIISGLPILEI